MRTRIALLILTIPALCGCRCLCGAKAVEDPIVFGLTNHPDRFFEVVSEQEGWGTTTGWTQLHVEQGWKRVHGRDQAVVLMISTSHDPDLRLPPVMEELTLERTADGVDLRRHRVVTAELPDEIFEFEPGHMVMPQNPQTGQEWVHTNGRFRYWSRVVDTGAPNPNPLVEEFADAPGCMQLVGVSTERRTSGALGVTVTESHWARGLGPVMIEEWSGVLFDVDADDPDLAALADRRGELNAHATLKLMPLGTP
jgi:hypothetical protein